ncbi:MAG: CDP-diacylglycerol--serine O-phosphatidyltransferase [Clostridia bacterium]|nr:CDP-diacylglycerol--serine O-phosphatidyltransferase [Deltaproteobacteria bacterium]
MADAPHPPSEGRNRRRKRRGRGPHLTIDLQKAMFVLPNLFTVSSIFCGFYAMVSLSADVTPRRLYEAALAIFFGIFFDMADGRVARMTRTQSAFGVQLDSLADVIVFGAAPGVVMYKFSLSHFGVVGMFICFVYVSCGALRLARFNVLAARSGGGASKFFVGLPIPLAAGVLMSLVMFHQRRFGGDPSRPELIAALTLGMALLMVSNVRYRTFKDIKPNRVSMSVAGALVLTFVIAAVAIQPTFALLAFVSGYVAYGLVEVITQLGQRAPEQIEAPAVPPKVGHES